MGEPKLGYNAPVSREEEANEDFTFKSAVYKHRHPDAAHAARERDNLMPFIMMHWLGFRMGTWSRCVADDRALSRVPAKRKAGLEHRAVFFKCVTLGWSGVEQA